MLIAYKGFLFETNWRGLKMAFPPPPWLIWCGYNFANIVSVELGDVSRVKQVGLVGYRGDN